MEQIVKALKTLRIGVVIEEFDLQAAIAAKLDEAGIMYQREYTLGPHNRVDFFIDGGIVIEVKKGKPYTRKVIEQLERYCSFDQVTSIILVIEKNLDIPKLINNKPCVSFGLNKLWGIALP